MSGGLSFTSFSGVVAKKSRFREGRLDSLLMSEDETRSLSFADITHGSFVMDSKTLNLQHILNPEPGRLYRINRPEWQSRQALHHNGCRGNMTDLIISPPVTAGAEGRSADELSQQVSDLQAVISARLLSDVLRPGSGERNDTSRTLTGDSGPVPNLLKLLPLLISFSSVMLRDW
ncbi:hypothetical protein MHYP_G00222110 [Metynnis hypsauchen]